MSTTTTSPRVGALHAGHDHGDHDHGDHGSGGGGSSASPPRSTLAPASFDATMTGTSAGEAITARLLYRTDLQALNGSGVTGAVDYAVAGNAMTVRVRAEGLEPDRVHIQHIHGAFDAVGRPKDSFTPGPAADVDGDGFLEVAEGVPTYGDILVNLNSPPGSGLAGFPTAPGGVVDFEQTYDLRARETYNRDYTRADLGDLALREFVIHGLSVDGTAGAGTPGEVDGTPGYKLALPAASGEIYAVGVEISAGGGNDTLTGAGGDDTLLGGDGDDVIAGRGGDDLVFAGAGNDLVRGEDGSDVVRAGAGNDTVFGGTGNDFVYGDAGDDVLHGDGGLGVGPRRDLGADLLVGGAGNDRLWVGDGLDTVTGGSGQDTFLFRFNTPQTPLAAGTGAAFATITDFRAADDTIAFAARGLEFSGAGAGFRNNGAPGTGGQVLEFFSGAAADARGESVMVLTDRSFATGLAAAQAVRGENGGDMILYHNSAVGVASLLFVSAPDVVNSIARFTDVTSIEALRATGFTAADFIFV